MVHLAGAFRTIPDYYHKVTGEPLNTEPTIAHLQDIVKSYSKERTEKWGVKERTAGARTAS